MADEDMRSGLVRTTVGVLLAVLSIAWANPIPDYYYVETPSSLSLPPEAASVALTGALAGADPGIAAAFFNPATLAGLTRNEATASYGPWQTESSPYNSHTWLGAYFPAGRFAVGIDASLTPRGSWPLYNRHGWPSGYFAARDATVGSRAAFPLAEQWSVGLGLKLFMSNATENRPMWPFPTYPLRATAVAPLLDLGVRWTPDPRIGLGLSVCDAGPNIPYAVDSAGPRANDATAPPPWTVRLGARLRMIDLNPVRVDLLGQISRTGSEGWEGVGLLTDLLEAARPRIHSIAVDALAWKTIAVRFGYLDDATLDKYGWTFGMGLLMADLLRIDFSIDAVTHTAAKPSRDWRLSATWLNLARLWRRE
jgi:hypothetical protein